MSESDMQLPEGKSCRGCYHFARCKQLFGCNGDNTTCDWSPSRFKPAFPALLDNCRAEMGPEVFKKFMADLAGKT